MEMTNENINEIIHEIKKAREFIHRMNSPRTLPGVSNLPKTPPNDLEVHHMLLGLDNFVTKLENCID